MHFFRFQNCFYNVNFLLCSQLPELVNSLSPQGQLPLQLALLGGSEAIAATLVQNGSADVNAYDGNVSSYFSYILIKCKQNNLFSYLLSFCREILCLSTLYKEAMNFQQTSCLIRIVM